MIDFAFKNQHLIIVLAMLTAVISLVAVQRLPVDILPNYNTSAVQVLTLYPGMPAEVMEKDITSRLERWTGQANGIDRQESYTASMDTVLRLRWALLGLVALLFLRGLWVFSKLGTELFPQMDVGQISSDVRLESGTRIEKTEAGITQIEQFIEQEIGGDLNPIPLGRFTYQGDLKQWDGKISLQKNKLEQFKNRYRQETTTAETQLQATGDQLAFGKEALRQAAEALDQSLEREKLGTVKPFEVFQSQQFYLQAQIDYLQAVANYNKAQFALKVSQGEILVSD